MNGNLLWRFETGDDVISSPALADINGDVNLDVFVGSIDDNIYALNSVNGKKIWNYEIRDYIIFY